VLIGVITPNSQERTVVSSFRFAAAFVGQLIVIEKDLAARRKGIISH
jgi:Na+/melibiose symporter-like transporter